MASLHCNCAGECRVTNCTQCGKTIPDADQRRVQHGLCLGCRALMIRPNWRQAGSRVQVHGYGPRRGGLSDVEVTGFRGTVEGCIGPCLTGITDDGREWILEPGVLQDEGKPPRDRCVPCTCCPQPAAQLDLFTAVADA